MYAPDLARIATPVGIVSITGDATWLIAITIGRENDPLPAATGTVVNEAAAQVAAWFAGTLTVFDLPRAPSATLRGAALRAAMVAVGYGSTVSYGALARAAGSSARAIGQACARNPFPIVVPCHRVTNADGSLEAYSAGDGPATKAALLDFERRGRIDRLL